MFNEILMQLALTATGYNQKKLGQELGVSPTQVSKWKRGEYMSADMEGRLRKLAGIGDLEPDIVVAAGSIEAAAKWKRLMKFLAESARESAETGYNTDPLLDELGTLASKTFSVLEEMGVTIPTTYPIDIDFDFDTAWEDETTDEAIFNAIEVNPYSHIISAVYMAVNDVYGFFAAYFSDLMDIEELDLYGTAAANIEPCLVHLAATKVVVDPEFAPRFNAFCAKTKKDYVGWISLVKNKAFQAGVPLKAELMNLVYESSDELSHSAEAESFGFNSTRIHPDIYMNELLVGMRVIHQVLPSILKKLGINEEFELDESLLSLGRTHQ